MCYLGYLPGFGNLAGNLTPARYSRPGRYCFINIIQIRSYYLL